VEGAHAMFDGVGSPLTQTFGLGMFEPPTAAGFDELESFFVSRGADVFHEVSPLSDPSTMAQLNERGYRPCELTRVMFRPIPSASNYLSSAGECDAGPGQAVRARMALPDELNAWADTAARGWSEFPEVLEFMKAFGLITAGAVDSYPFLAEVDGHLAA